jgi:hypothetical protein
MFCIPGLLFRKIPYPHCSEERGARLPVVINVTEKEGGVRGREAKKKGLSEPLLSYAALRLVRIFVFEFRIACRVFSGLNPK